MSSPKSVDEWGPSQASGAKQGPRWSLWCVAGLMVAWFVTGGTVVGMIAWGCGGCLVVLAFWAWLGACVERSSPTWGISGSHDLLMAVRDESRRHRAGVYLGASRRGRWTFGRCDQAMLVLGPPRSGKSSGLIVPALLSHPGPAVSASTKPDVMRATVAARSWMGKVWQFDPTGTGTSPAANALRWSPVTGSASWDGAMVIARSMVFGADVAAGTTNQTHWTKRASALLAPLLHAAVLGDRDIGTVVEWTMSHA
jgi:type IV secretory pathway TraG/TraD family ATPase VirD4